MFSVPCSGAENCKSSALFIRLRVLVLPLSSIGPASELPEARAAYQKALSMSQQEPEKRFLKKRLAELSNLGDAKRLRVRDK
jgi:hypothetical protein